MPVFDRNDWPPELVRAEMTVSAGGEIALPDTDEAKTVAALAAEQRAFTDATGAPDSLAALDARLNALAEQTARLTAAVKGRARAGCCPKCGYYFMMEKEEPSLCDPVVDARNSEDV